MLPARDDEPGQTVLRHLWLSPEQARSLAAEFESRVMRRHQGDATRGEAYGLLVSLYRADIPVLPAD